MKNHLNQKVAEVLRGFQEANRFTQTEMAKKLNISQASYNNWVNNAVVVSYKYYPSIAVLCGVSLKLLIPSDVEVSLSSKLAATPLKLNAQELYHQFMSHLEEENTMLKQRIVGLEETIASYRKEQYLAKSLSKIRLKSKTPC